MVLALKFKSSIHFELIFCIWHGVGVQLHAFVSADPLVSGPFVEEIVLSPRNGLGILVQKICWS